MKLATKLNSYTGTVGLKKDKSYGGFFYRFLLVIKNRPIFRGREAKQKYFRIFPASYLLSQPQRHDVNPRLCDIEDLAPTLTMRCYKNGYFTFSGG